jgi:hypothetical protein
VDDEEFTTPRADWPINRALASLGAGRDDGSGTSSAYLDLFHRVGLGWERSSERWRVVGRTDRESGYAAALKHRETGFRAEAERARRRHVDELPVVLDGRTIMKILDVGPGPVVGAASRHLRELTLERGALTPDEAVAVLLSWASASDVAEDATALETAGLTVEWDGDPKAGNDIADTLS